MSIKKGDTIERTAESHMGMRVGDRSIAMENSDYRHSIRLKDFEGGHSTINLKVIKQINWRERLSK